MYLDISEISPGLVIGSHKWRAAELSLVFIH